ncbi:MAG: VTT domain-containing protein [Candidatus Omnitrophota bacterium]|nr:VTT domain-containing protein [Candidatus Omnitrophota bacterium]
MDLAPHKNKLGFLILVIALFLIWYLGGLFHIDYELIRGRLSSLPLFFSGIIFVVLYVVVTFFIWFSKDIFRVIAAVVFGALWSTLFILIAETINAFILFHASRYLGRGFVEKSLRGSGSRFDQRIGRANFLWLLIFRAAPLVPFRFLDLACGLTRISFRKYLSAVILASPLRIFWVQFALAGAGEVVFRNPYALSEYIASNKPLFILSLAYLALVVAAALKLKDKKWQ